jgi:hypothetical protein
LSDGAQGERLVPGPYYGTGQPASGLYGGRAPAGGFGDLDCADLSGPLYVGGSDPHGFDADNDGIGCE